MANKLESTNQTTENYPIGNAQTSKTTTSEYPRHFRKYHPLCQDYFDRVEAAGGGFNVGTSIGVEEFTIRNAHDELFRGLASYINDGSIQSLALFCGTSFEGLGVAAVGPDYGKTNVVAGYYAPVRNGAGNIGVLLGEGSRMECDNDFAIVNPTNMLSADGYAAFGYTTKGTYQSLLADYFNLTTPTTFDLTNDYDGIRHNVDGTTRVVIGNNYDIKYYVAAGYYPTASGYAINLDSDATVSSSGTLPASWSNIGAEDNTYFRLGSYESIVSDMQIAFGGFLTDFALSGSASFKTPLKKFVTALGVPGTGLDV